ncbi:MAG: nucleotidyltransferase domain-containing protein [Verrucomicrobiota bacterium]|nr:nucleotidyltransferase domain-containing protein [Verrucomicrobiota bacterium]
MTLLQQMAYDRARRRETLRLATRRQLRRALRTIVPAQRVVLFGSLVKPGRFSEISDIDLALEREPSGMTHYQLTSLLAERLGRRVDIVLLPECRFRDRIAREGEVWMPKD